MKTKLLIFLLFVTITINAQTNLVSNGDFENWTSSSQPDNWFRYFSGFVSKSTSAQNGTSSTNMKIADGTFNYINSEYFPVVANKTYRITLYHKLVSGSFSAIDLSLYHKPGTFKSEIIKKTDATISSTEWRKIEFDYTPTASENIEVDIWTTGTLNSEILVDNVSVVDVATIGAQYTLIPDVNFEKKLIALGIDSGATDGKVLTNSVNKLTSLDVSSSAIVDLTGIQDFVSLTYLDCGRNKLTTLNISKNIALQVFYCYNNQLTNLDLSQNVALHSLDCNSNRLTSLVISKNTNLNYISCASNKLSTIDLSKNLKLQTLYISGNLLTTLDITNNTALNILNCSYNEFLNLNITANLALQTLSCYVNKLTSLDVTKNVALTELYCYNNQLTSLNLSNNIALNSLQTQNNQLTNLDISKNSNLTQIECSNNKLLNLNLKNGNNQKLKPINGGFQNNPFLNCILVDNADYAIANWLWQKNNTAVYSETDCALITLIPDSKFEDKLIALSIDTNGKNGSVLTSNINSITTLDVSNSSITDLTGIQDFAKLETLNCSSNQIKTLDISKNVSITSLHCENNNLYYLNLKNGKNSAFINNAILFTSNPKLTCIEVDNATYSNTNWATAKDQIATFNEECGPYTLIPDPLFENQLIALGIDTDGKNGKVKTESIAKVTSLDVSYSYITDLTGIQDFKNLERLACNYNNISKLDVSSNKSLTNLSCKHNLLSALEVSQNLKLTFLDCSENQIVTLKTDLNTSLTDLRCEVNKLNSLDVTKNLSLYKLSCYSNQLANLNVSKNNNLEILYCGQNQLTSIDVSSNSLLREFYCDTNKLTAIDVSKNSLLSYFDCGKNNLSTIDITKNTSLINLFCRQNQLTALDVTKNTVLSILILNTNQISSLDVSKNLVLNTLGCSDNKLTALDLSKNTLLLNLICSGNKLESLDISGNKQLKSLNCKDNSLVSLNLKNGNNTSFTYNSDYGLQIEINFKGNPDLSCIEVDSKIYSDSKWSQMKDYNALFNENCSSYTKIPDSNFEDKLIALGIDTDGKNGKVMTASINTLTTLNVSNCNITNLEGIQEFAKLETLNCSSNQLTSLDITKNLSLTSLHCENNKLVMLNLNNGKNTLFPNTSLLLTNNPNLTCIQVDNETYSNTNWVNFKDSTASFSTFCEIFTAIPDSNFEDRLIALNIDKDGKNGKVVTSSINKILSLNVNKSNIANLTGIEDFSALEELMCNENLLTTLDLSKNIYLNRLECNSNQLTNLNNSNNLLIRSLECTNNKLTSMNISQNVFLANLNCSSNQITNLSTTNNVLLSSLYMGNNKVSALDLSKNVNLMYITCHNNLLTSLDISNNKKGQYVNCNNNKLTYLNLKNGNSTPLYVNLDLANYKNNPDLKCIQVNDIKFANANWNPYKDATARFSEDCGGPIVFLSNNFTVESKGETCTGSNNGEINITGTATYAYKAKINAGSYTFTNNSLKVPNLAPGTYTVSITIPGETFEQSFTVIIPKGATITGKSSVVANKVSVEITEGTAPYTVFVDGVEQFETTDSNFTVETKKGGLLQIKTVKACEGIYAKDIARLDGAISAYPNPTSGSFEIELPTTKKEVVITLYTLQGQMISTKTYTVENGKAQLSLENQPAGVYVAKIELDTQDYLKIIKN
jgi:Leucine-rich repeat (LRR) protein